VKFLAVMIAGLLLISSGCGIAPTTRAAAPAEEVRHPSNEMVPLKKEEPEHTVAAKRPPRKPPQRVLAFEDPRRIPAGIEYREMLRRFGPPSMKVTDAPSRTTFSYSRLKTQVQVEVQNGKVVSVLSINTGF